MLHIYQTSYLIIIFISKFPGAKVQYKIELALKECLIKQNDKKDNVFVTSQKKCQ